MGPYDQREPKDGKLLSSRKILSYDTTFVKQRLCVTSCLSTQCLVFHTTMFIAIIHVLPLSSPFTLFPQFIFLEMANILELFKMSVGHILTKQETLHRSIDHYHMPQKPQTDLLECLPPPIVSDYLTSCLFHISTWTSAQGLSTKYVQTQSPIDIQKTGTLPQSRICFLSII